MGVSHTMTCANEMSKLEDLPAAPYLVCQLNMLMHI